MGIKSKLKTWFFLDEDYVEEYEEEIVQQRRNEPDRHIEEPRKTLREKQKQNIVSISSVQKASKVIILEPKSFEESPEIAEHVKSKKAVVINLQMTDRIEARRIIDFLGGTVYALNGDIQKIGSDIFLCTPDNVEVTGTISEGFVQDFEDTRW